MKEEHKKTYLDSKVVNHYLEYTVLQNPEKVILGLLTEEIKQFKMLDVGVGAGRTTSFFADKVKEYKAVDYSEKMIDACKIKFRNKIPEENFIVTDARDLSIFESEYFDFVLFSFNGPDHVSHEEREKIFKEIKRVLKPGGYFCFSSHNLQSTSNWGKIKLLLNPFGMIQRILINRKLLRINKEQLKNCNSSGYLMLNDGAHDFGLVLYYIRPSFQIQTLKEIGYAEIRVFELSKGKELDINNEKELSCDTSSWLYYLCRKL